MISKLSTIYQYHVSNTS